MTRASQQTTLGYVLADAHHVLKAVGKHWPALQALGTTESERKRFSATIAEAEKGAQLEGTAPLALEDARQTLKDLLGEYRSAATLVVHGIDGRDAKAEEALRMKGKFPASDVQLSTYCQNLGSRLKPFAAKLAQRGFSKEKQAELAAAVAQFSKAYGARGKERGDARAQALAREVLFKRLRVETSYFRKVGQEAMRSAVSRADFDRVKVRSKAMPTVAPVPPAPEPVKAPANA